MKKTIYGHENEDELFFKINSFTKVVDGLYVYISQSLGQQKQIKIMSYYISF